MIEMFAPARFIRVGRNHWKGVTVPQVTIRTEIDGREETISEYMCDWPDCPNVAVEVLGVVRELRLRSVICAQHAALIRNRRNNQTGR